MGKKKFIIFLYKYRRLITKKIDVSKYNIFMINDPKCKIIMVEYLEDKIINYLNNEHILVRIFDRKFINGENSTRKGYYTLYGV